MDNTILLNRLMGQLVELKTRIEHEKECVTESTEHFQTEAKSLLDKVMEQIERINTKQLEDLEEKERRVLKEIEEVNTRLKDEEENLQYSELKKKIEKDMISAKELSESTEEITIVFEDMATTINSRLVPSSPLLLEICEEFMEDNKIYIFRSGELFHYVCDFLGNKSFKVEDSDKVKVAQELDFYKVNWHVLDCFKNTFDTLENVKVTGGNYKVTDNVVESMSDGIAWVCLGEDTNICEFTLKVLNKGKFLDDLLLSFGYCRGIATAPVIGRDGYFMNTKGEVHVDFLGKYESLNSKLEVEVGDSVTISLNSINNVLTYCVNNNEKYSFDCVNTAEKLVPTIILKGKQQKVEIVSYSCPIDI